MTEHDKLQLIEAWKRCVQARHWPAAIDTLLTADWSGTQIVWPQYRSKRFSIFRARDSSTVAEEELPTDVALAMRWDRHRLAAPVRWSAPGVRRARREARRAGGRGGVKSLAQASRTPDS